MTGSATQGAAPWNRFTDHLDGVANIEIEIECEMIGLKIIRSGCS
jgi:hypothetical protein